MAKTLKIWNGRGHGKFDRGHIYVAAFSKKQAAELISQACGYRVSVSEITVYYSPCWGNPMNGITADEPCVYASEKMYDEKPQRII